MQGEQNYGLWKGKTRRLPRLPAFVESTVGQICRRAGNESAGGVENVGDLQSKGGASGRMKAGGAFKARSCQ